MNLRDRQDRDYLAEWLYSVNEVPVSENNWLFFYILINTALKVNGLKYSKQRLEEGLEKINSFYLGDGWYCDEFTGAKRTIMWRLRFIFMVCFTRVCRRIGMRTLLSAGPGGLQRILSTGFDTGGRSLPFGRV